MLPQLIHFILILLNCNVCYSQISSVLSSSLFPSPPAQSFQNASIHSIFSYTSLTLFYPNQPQTSNILSSISSPCFIHLFLKLYAAALWFQLFWFLPSSALLVLSPYISSSCLWVLHTEVCSMAVMQAGFTKVALICLVRLLVAVKSHWAQLFCCSCIFLFGSSVDWAIWVWSSSPVCFEQPAASHRTRNFTSFLHQILPKTPDCVKPPAVALQAEADNFVLGSWFSLL